ncbi:unnamed protein product [Trichogramma brassicae]|uniref:Uncharacterized protein n=1 Tax=Trichogramma brassicae TaxID=86971 RepID=A0A6H5IQC5_9HYME|nr:unnamed protein product [Trichogramma brassicae]
MKLRESTDFNNRLDARRLYKFIPQFKDFLVTAYKFSEPEELSRSGERPKKKTYTRQIAKKTKLHYFGLEGRSHTANPRARLSVETFMWVRKSYALVPPALQCAVATATAAAKAAASLGHLCIWEHVYLQSETKAARDIKARRSKKSWGCAHPECSERDTNSRARASADIRAAAAAAAAAGRNHRALNSAISGRFARAHDPRGLAAMASHARGTHRHARHDVGSGGGGGSSSSACVHVYHRGPISFFPYRVDLRRSMQ